MFFDDPISQQDLWDVTAPETSNDFIEFERFSGYEVDSQSSAQTASNSERYEIAIQSQQPLNQLMFISMLEHICSLYADDENSSEALFKVICKKLKSGTMIPDLEYLDGFKAVRMKYQMALKKLMEGSVLAIKHQDLHSLQPEEYLKLKSVATSSFSTHSWYKDMFSMKDEEHLADGGFGKVVKSKNKLDNKHYAIKKIPLIDTDIKKILKTLREVQIFSDLDHVNIVRYHSSWLEHSTDIFQAGNLPNKDKSNMKKEAVKEVNGLVRFKSVQLSSGNFGFDVSSDGQRETYSQACSLQPLFTSDFHKEQQFLKDSIESIPINQKPPGQPKVKLLKMTLFIQMELCNKTLRSWLHQRNKKIKGCNDVDKSLTIHIFYQILCAVQYIHKQGLMHRDLKPANVFLTYKNEKITVKVGDFGLARYHPTISSPISPTLDTSSPFVFTHNVEEQTAGVGTTTYAAPEQMKNSSYSNKVDIWSLGIILFELFRPFSTEMERGVLIQDLLHRHIVCEQMKRKWSLESDMVMNMTCEEPDNRPDASDLLKIFATDEKQDILVCLQNQIESQEKEIKTLQMLLKEQLCIKCKLPC